MELGLEPEQVAVIIPYFQREPGILRRALLSICAQSMPSPITIRCIIVDDGSPHPAEAEIPRGDNCRKISFVVVRQANGGVSAARNTALEHVPQSTDYVAYLDSDDTWSSDHIARALNACRLGADFYFSDCLLEDGMSWFSAMPAFAKLIAPGIGDDRAEPGIAVFQPGNLALAFITDCPSHTSSVVYRFSKFRDARFNPALRSAGEDHLFWYDLVRRASSIAVDPQATASRGHGIDLYRSAQSWDSPECLARLCGNLLKYLILRDLVPGNLQGVVTGQLNKVRQEILVVLIRSANTRPDKASQAVRFIWKNDRAFFLMVPGNVLALIQRRHRTGQLV